MERVYRGYPQALRMMEAGAAQGQRAYGAPVRPSNLPYSQESPGIQPPAVRNRRFVEQEAEYFKGLYPQPVRGDQRLVEEACSRMDYMGSPMYDQYPDREFIYRLRDMIAHRSGELGFHTSRELIQVLLVNEINRRRMLRLGAGLLVQR